MGAPDQLRQALEAGDFRLSAKIMAEAAPHLPSDPADAEAAMHMTRTAAVSVSFRARAYSHRWLTERDLPSMLPDNLKPKAERLYPRVVEAVGISVRTDREWMKPAVPLIRGAMERAVLDCFANGDRDPQLVKDRMMAARADEAARLFGRGAT